MTSLISQRKMSKNSNLKSLSEVNKTQSCQLDPFLDPEGQPNSFEPNFEQNWVEPQKTGRDCLTNVDKFSLMHLRKETQ